MKKLLAATALVLVSVSPAFAAGKTYQVTGPVTAIDNNKIIVQKDKDKWEIARDKNSKVPASVKVGEKVTIQYTMTAVTVEDKGPLPAAAGAAPAAKPAPAPKKK